MSPTPSKYSCVEDVFINDGSEKKRQFPYEIVKVDPEINSQLLKDFTGEHTGFVQVGPQKWFLPSPYEKEAENYYNFEVRPDDVWIVTFPRSGTTWTQEMLWLIANDLDYKTAAEIPLTARFPFLEFSMCVHPEMKAKFLEENNFCNERQAMVEAVATPAWKTLAQQTGRRFIKTHLPFSLLPPNLLTAGCKVIYIARNPKDVAVSYYHLNRLARTQGFTGDFNNFFEYFEKNLVTWAPYWTHLQEGWEKRNAENVLFLFYEQLNKDLRGGIEKVARFMGKCLNETQLDKLEDHLKIENFRNNKSVNFDVLNNLGILAKGEQGFIRKGQTGGWKDLFTEELSERADVWIEENLKKTDLRFPC